MSLSPPVDLRSKQMLPTWESRTVLVDTWRLSLSVSRNPYRKVLWDRIRDDAVRVRYWNVRIVLRCGYRRVYWWHFVDRENGVTR